MQFHISICVMQYLRNNEHAPVPNDVSYSLTMYCGIPAVIPDE